MNTYEIRSHGNGNFDFKVNGTIVQSLSGVSPSGDSGEGHCYVGVISAKTSDATDVHAAQVDYIRIDIND